MDKAEILAGLAQCTGTHEYHRFSILFKNLVITDGVKFLADNAGCYWLLDILGSYQSKPLVRAEPFQTWKFDRKSMMVRATDGNDKKLAAQKIPYSDFPLSEISLFVIDNGDGFKVILLPSEY
jgi:hypothetical protein